MLVVKSADAAVRALREIAAERVLAKFGDQIAKSDVLCFLDDRDWKPFKDRFGTANRGFYGPLTEAPLPGWPDYLRALIFIHDTPQPLSRQLAFQDIVYLHGTTCSTEVGLTITLAHELQHFVQHSHDLETWAANSLASYTLQHVLHISDIEALGMSWCDIPHEREARIVSKRIAEELFGVEAVREYIDARIAERVTEQDAADWKRIRHLAVLGSYDLRHETAQFFPRLNGYKHELERALRHLQTEGPNYGSVDLNALLVGRWTT
jgi:hypothetical protein